jgi:cell division protein FtsI/penicillin-binding protein 2
MKNDFQQKNRNRTLFMAGLFIVWFGILALRLVQLQVLDHAKLKNEVESQHQNIVTISPKRGTIFDRQGSILAASLPCFSLYYSPPENIPADRHYARIRKLSRPLNLSSRELRRIRASIEKKATFIYIKRKMLPPMEEKIRDRLEEGMHLLEESRRSYPRGTLAAHLLGRVNIDGKGQSGVELSYDPLLQGRSGKNLTLRDARRRKYRFDIVEDPVPGEDLYLTIDETIQYLAAHELRATVKEFEADWGTIIVSRPDTGEILALANSPEPNPNRPEQEWRRIDWNNAVRNNIDPGSTFKIITAAAALENGSAGLEDVYDVHLGLRRFGARAIRDHHRYESLDFPGVIIHSSNVGTTLIADQVGPQRLYEMIQAFGLGRRTGIDLPAEERGLLNPLDDWTKYSHNYISVGYEINVTAAQMLQVVNTVANHGVAAPLHVVRPTPELLALSGGSSPQPRRVISEATAATLDNILKRVVTEGTGRPARIPGYIVAGKTGTAQKMDPKTGGYSSKEHMSSFAGYISAGPFMVSIIVVLDNPKGKYYGGDVAAPVFQRVGSRILQILGIPAEPEIEPRLLTADLKGVEGR